MGLSSFSSKVVQIPEELVDEQHPLRYKPFDHYGYLHFFDKEKIQEPDSRLKAYCGIWNLHNDKGIELMRPVVLKIGWLLCCSSIVIHSWYAI